MAQNRGIIEYSVRRGGNDRTDEPVQEKLRLKICLCAVAVIAVATFTSIHAQESTQAQRQACKPDVYRLCKLYIPSHDGITYCLHQNIARLSRACRAVMEGKLR
jgi:hypothetical protein